MSSHSYPVRFLFAAALLATSCRSYAGELYRDVTAETVKTRLGILSVGPGKNGYKDGLYLNGTKIYEGEDSDSLTLSEPLAVAGSEVVLVGLSSGGIACPSEFAVVELRHSPVVSETFGTCSNTLRTKVAGNTLEIWMPTPVPHPELISKVAAKRIASKVTLYRWANGILVKVK